MPIQVLCDLHVEFDTPIPPPAPDAGFVVLAGDLAPAFMRRIGEVAETWAGAEQILHVPGNHEHYGSAIERARHVLALDCKLCDITLLDPGPSRTLAVRDGQVVSASPRRQPGRLRLRFSASTVNYGAGLTRPLMAR